MCCCPLFPDRIRWPTRTLSISHLCDFLFPFSRFSSQIYPSRITCASWCREQSQGTLDKDTLLEFDRSSFSPLRNILCRL
ncbi:uncharacterized protein P884DRAFT_255900 [Thermothelomyces heterothallicus CBS 202.75]|uniref:uncharacterized protein n=1 Tax=Thermothelomyces heterothallicus CBS 202.75 TaxID=1149848 RepID=UPI0037424411